MARPLIGLVGVLLIGLAFLFPPAPLEAQVHVCGSGPGPGERQVGMTQGGNGVGAVPMCVYDGNGGAASPVAVQDDFVAFATDDTGSKLFWSTYYHGQPSADQAAVASCSRATGRRCRPLGGVYNQCGALARTDDGQVFNGGGTNESLAARTALAACNRANAANNHACSLWSLPVCAGQRYAGNASSEAASVASNEVIDRMEARSEDRHYWAALATSDGTNATGVYGYRTRDAAEQAARDECKGCRVVRSFENTCVGMAWLGEKGQLRDFTASDVPEVAHDKAQKQCTTALGAPCSAAVRCVGRRYPKPNPFAGSS